MRDMVSNIQIVQGVPQTITGAADTAGRAVDVRGFGGLGVYMQTGTVTVAGTAGFSARIQHSDTLVGTDFVDVPAAEREGSIAAVTADASDNITAAGGITYLGSKRYVRTVFTGTTNTNAVAQALYVLGKPHRAPTTPVGATLATS